MALVPSMLSSGTVLITVSFTFKLLLNGFLAADDADEIGSQTPIGRAATYSCWCCWSSAKVTRCDRPNEPRPPDDDDDDVDTGLPAAVNWSASATVTVAGGGNSSSADAVRLLTNIGRDVAWCWPQLHDDDLGGLPQSAAAPFCCWYAVSCGGVGGRPDGTMPAFCSFTLTACSFSWMNARLAPKSGSRAAVPRVLDNV